MTQVYGWLYFFGSIITSYYLASSWSDCSSRQRYPSMVSILFAILFLSVFLGCQLITGLIGLIANRPLFSIEAAFYLLVIVSFIAIFTSKISISKMLAASFRLDDADNQKIGRDAKIFLVISTITIINLSMLLVIGFPRGFEVTAYHLPIAVNMFRDHSLAVWDRAYMHAYPANMSVWTGFWLTLLPERVVSIANLPFLVFTIFGLYRLMRLIRSDKDLSLILSLGVVSIPLFGFSATELGSDVAGVACLVAAVYLILGNHSGDVRITFIAGLAAGLAFGFKSLHLVGIGLLGLMLTFGLTRSWEEISKSFIDFRIKKLTFFATGFF